MNAILQDAGETHTFSATRAAYFALPVDITLLHLLRIGKWQCSRIRFFQI